jgi:hypothetical protein
MAVLVTGLLLSAGCADFTIGKGHAQHDPGEEMYDEPAGGPAEPMDSN